MDEETVHKSPVHKDVHDRKEYRKKWMQEKRAAEKLKKELGEDQSGKVSLASLEKESVVETVLGDNDGVTRGAREVVQDIPLTSTDRKFEALYPGYYIYVKDVKKRECFECGRKFETRLELLKFCSPQHQAEYVKKLATLGKRNDT